MFKSIGKIFKNYSAILFFVGVGVVWWWLDSEVDSIGEERKAKEAAAYQEKLVSLGPFVQKVIEMQPRGLDQNLEIDDIRGITIDLDSTLEFEDYFLDNNFHISSFLLEDVQRIEDQYEYFSYGYESLFSLKCKIKPNKDFKYESFIITFKVEKVENNFKNRNPDEESRTLVSGTCYEMKMADSELFNDAKDLILDIDRKG